MGGTTEQIVWDQQPEVRSPVGQPLSELLADGPQRQSLPGFEPCYRDFVDYIIRCTHRIWEQKDVGLCRTHYGEDCRLHTFAGPVVGAEAVVQNTISALGVFSDRVVVGGDAIWSEDGPGLFYSSHGSLAARRTSGTIRCSGMRPAAQPMR